MALIGLISGAVGAVKGVVNTVKKAVQNVKNPDVNIFGNPKGGGSSTKAGMEESGGALQSISSGIQKIRENIVADQAGTFPTGTGGTSVQTGSVSGPADTRTTWEKFLGKGKVWYKKPIIWTAVGLVIAIGLYLWKRKGKRRF